ncbi:MAG: glutamate--tRNA ligase [Planctomycetes bacterium]|nr:glutamate--tRNA ligase [Planctomycetota bacterium]
MVRTRFAPSPTGYLHIGGVRTALFNWLFARQHGGQFILRIDDTDQKRNVAEALQPILDGFRWLGIDWDEGPEVGGPHAPYFQSQRADRHRVAVEQLVRDGRAYRDYALPEELQAERQQAEGAKQPFTYSRRWMAATDADAARFESEGRQAVVRLKMPREGSCQFHDLVRGDMVIPWATEQDHVVQRADGSCLYHLASVVDDHDYRISHVIRAVEHLSNTPRQIFIAQSLGYPLPAFAHLPYVAEPGSSNKLSKRKLDKYLKNRDFRKLFEHGQRIAALIGHESGAETFNPVIVDFYRTVGYLPEALVNYLLLLGWSLDDRTEQFTRSAMIEHFSLERVNKAPASFDPTKLWAFQQREMLALPAARKVALVWPFVEKAGWIKPPFADHTRSLVSRIVTAAGDRIKVAGDILDYEEFFCSGDRLPMDAEAVEKRLRKPGASELVGKFRRVLAALEPFDGPSTESALRSFAAAEGVPLNDVVHALRVAATGKSVGLGLFESLEILGRAEVLARIDRALALA